MRTGSPKPDPSPRLAETPPRGWLRRGASLSTTIRLVNCSPKEILTTDYTQYSLFYLLSYFLCYCTVRSIPRPPPRLNTECESISLECPSCWWIWKGVDAHSQTVGVDESEQDSSPSISSIQVDPMLSSSTVVFHFTTLSLLAQVHPMTTAEASVGHGTLNLEDLSGPISRERQRHSLG